MTPDYFDVMTGVGHACGMSTEYNKAVLEKLHGEFPFGRPVRRFGVCIGTTRFAPCGTSSRWTSPPVRATAHSSQDTLGPQCAGTPWAVVARPHGPRCGFGAFSANSAHSRNYWGFGPPCRN